MNNSIFTTRNSYGYSYCFPLLHHYIWIS